MTPTQRNILLLAVAQGFLLTNGVTLVAVNGLVGVALAPSLWLATFPVTAYVIGAAATTLPAAFFMKHHGRRAGFMLGSGLGIAGALTSAYAVSIGSFWLLCAGTLLAGAYNAFGQQYRFAAADAADLTWKSRAISLTLAGGILGGIIGPELSKHTRALLEPTFMASYLVLAVFAFLSLLIASRLDIPPLSGAEQHAKGRPLREIALQPKFIVAVLAAACGYGVMNLLMTATPIAMDLCRYPFNDAAFVLEWHVIGMFAPSFFTGHLIRRFGVLPIMFIGALLNFLCIGVALSGISVMHFWWALTLLGVGWNFLYIGGTTLLTETYRPEEKAKAQGFNDFLVFAVQGMTSLASGVLITGEGWNTLNLIAIPAIAVTAIATLALWWRQRAAPAA
ncbi:MAG: MFS transporter [Gammaproteobacteria bacterium]|nr:MFS transporter [Gammaproteobacteria bacterium]MBU1647298.1 MFS transporter [Gammaproteobacteria bacterium]MBU1971059.1 MFS transporter [Gammaproteobacteria bacterium]